MADETGAAVLDAVEAVAKAHPATCACTPCLVVAGNPLALAELAYGLKGIGAEVFVADVRDRHPVAKRERNPLPCPACLGGSTAQGCELCDGSGVA